MTNELSNQWQELKTILEGEFRSTPKVVSDVRNKSGEAADALEAVFAELRNQTDAMNLEMANYAKDFEAPLEDARAWAKAAADRLAAMAAAKPVAHAPDLPGDLAPTYARQMRERYAPTGPAKKAVDSDDSRVWFDASLVAPSSASANADSADARSLLAAVSHRVAVWWTCVALSDALQAEWETMPASERGAIEKSVEWVLQPTPAAQSSLAALAKSSPPDTIAAALGSLFGAIGAHDPNQPAGGEVAGAAVLTLQFACRRQSPAASDAIMRRSRDLARDMKAGKRLWTEGTGDASASVADSLATFSRWTDG